MLLIMFTNMKIYLGPEIDELEENSEITKEKTVLLYPMEQCH